MLFNAAVSLLVTPNVNYCATLIRSLRASVNVCVICNAVEIFYGIFVQTCLIFRFRATFSDGNAS